LARVVTRVALGAPDLALAPAVAPMAPEPPVPLVSVPVKVTTVMEAGTLCDSVAFTLTLDRVAEAKARQISAVPRCVLVRQTSAQVWLAPVTPVTVMPDELAPVDTNASSNSLVAVVENEGDVMLVLELELSVDLTWSMVMAPHAGAVAAKIRNKPRARLNARRTYGCPVAAEESGNMGTTRLFQWAAGYNHWRQGR
jgi:hypothetical protein